MALNDFLKSRIPTARKIVKKLDKEFDYISILGSYTKFKRISTNGHVSDMSDIDGECGFVIKLCKDGNYSEFACNDIKNLDLDELRNSIRLDELKQERVKLDSMDDEKMEKSFSREDKSTLSDEEILEKLNKIRNKVVKYDARIIQVNAVMQKRSVSKIFVSRNKTLDQCFDWTNTMLMAVSRDGDNIKQVYTSENEVDTRKALSQLNKKALGLAELSIKMLSAKPIVPGTYEIITDPTISGLIAHEAFGHGVEMDMFVKNRAKAKEYVGKKVASEKVNMHDGAAAAISAGSYFFDDDGVLASDTQIIKDGILQTGISDLLSAMQLGSKPTGNGRRQSFDHKAYTRMTNTFFAPGEDDVDQMIKSVKHGYMLFDTNNGMEDPKNWQIQCTATYGLEIKDGQFTGEIVSPVVISGYVVDLLNSITMVSKDFRVIGSGMCGKGHKEWVYVADGGPYLKGEAKLA